MYTMQIVVPHKRMRRCKWCHRHLLVGEKNWYWDNGHVQWWACIQHKDRTEGDIV